MLAVTELNSPSNIEETLNLEINSAPEANGDMYAKSHRGRFKCWKCGRRFRTKKLFVLHNGVPKIFKCDFTPSESYMKRHSKFHVGNNLEKDIPKRQKDENSNGNEGYGHFKCTKYVWSQFQKKIRNK